VINMDDGNTGIIRYAERMDLLDTRSWVIHFDRFCSPEKLRLDVHPDGEVSVWGEADFLSWKESQRAAGEGPGLQLGSIPYVYGFCPFKISPGEARRVLVEMGLIGDRVLAVAGAVG